MNLDNNNTNPFIANPSLKVDHVHLKVSNLQNSVNFYQSILGFNVFENKSSENTAYLGPKSSSSSDNDKSSAILVLTQMDNYKKTHQPTSEKNEAGLYHFAILLPERKFLASFLHHIQKNLDPQFYEGLADHAVSESIYIHDPDYNGIEVYRDRKQSEWKWTNENKVHMITEPLDVNNLFNQHSNETWDGLPIHTSIGHVHLHVSSLIKAKKFYQESLGLYHTASYPGAYFFAADGYHHHIATNTWIGTNILPSSTNDPSKPGLEHYAIRLPNDKEEVKRLKNHLIKKGITIDEKLIDSDKHYNFSFYAYDQDGIKIQFLFK